VLTDPPYPNLKGGYKHAFPKLGKAYQETVTVGDPWKATLKWVPPAMSITDAAIVFASYHSVAELAIAFSAWRRVMLLTWHKRNAPPTGKNVPRFDTEFAWCFANCPGLKWDGFETTLFQVPNLTSGCLATERITDATGKPLHPAQKPKELIKGWLARTEASSVCDPHAGTGTTLLAAKELGVRSYGVEISERYCEIAVNRLKQEVFDFG